jgi:hypothetical protein
MAAALLHHLRLRLSALLNRTPAAGMEAAAGRGINQVGHQAFYGLEVLAHRARTGQRGQQPWV